MTTYNHDELDRVTARSYSDETPDVAYFYDSQPLPDGAPALDRGKSAGRLVAVTYGGGTLGNYSGGLDRLGQPHLSRQITEGGPAAGYTFSYDYNLSGQLKTQTYPSGRVVETQYDAAGRIAGVKKQGGLYYVGGDPGIPNNAEVIKYTPHGAVSALRLGNGLWEHTDFNSNLQVTRTGLGTSATNSSTLRLDYTYGTDDAHNNGNVRTQSIKVPWLTQPYVQTYGYDKLNRLHSAEESNTDIRATPTWKQVYAYDRYGNRTLDSGTTYPAQLNGTTNPAVSPADNHITSPDYSYDDAGNLLCDPLHRCVQGASSLTPYYEYDAENRMKRAGGPPSGGGADYTYDAAGHRVKKASGAVTTIYVYDAAGQLAAEYGGETAQTHGVSFVTQDAMGSTRAITGQSQSDERGRYDYLPFGEEVYADRSNYGGNNDLKQKFAGKENDTETGLNYFGARYHSAVAGRFTSVDPSQVSVKMTDPQSWNRYTYALNNPLAYVDHNGKWPTGIHHLIIDRVFAGLSGKQRDAIKSGSDFVDDPTMGGQNTENANQHGMAKPGQSRDDAAKGGYDFIDANLYRAQRLYARRYKRNSYYLPPGLNVASLRAFGMAWHTVSDMI